MSTWAERLYHFDPHDKYRHQNPGLIFDIQRFSVHDGPGIRTTVFLKGCPLQCIWCQNPESISFQPQITQIVSKCINCNKCIEVCQEHAIQIQEGNIRFIHEALCNYCGKCIQICYAGAMNIFGRYLSADELMREVERDRQFYIRSGGGVTFSGGEPLVQPEFLLEACLLSKQRGFHVAVDTCGYAKWETFLSILQYVDLFLYDIKHMDSSEHKRLTGFPNELILDNLRRLAALNKPIRVRLPLVPGANDTEENIQATAEFVAALPTIQALDILPYHRLGEPKWRQLGQEYELGGVAPPEKQHVFELAELARVYNIEVNIGG